MLDILAQFDALGLGAIVGSLLFLAGLIRVLVDNRSFEEVNRRHENAVAPKARPAATAIMTTAADRATVGEPEGRPPRRPVRARRAA